jgi:hypothetical protein
MGTGGTRLLHDPKRITERAAWDPEAWKKSREPALVIFVALHGGVDSREGYLYIDDPRGGRLRLQEDVIDGLASVTKEKRVLLILDATQVSDHWTDGILHNDFARRLEGLDDRIKAQDNLLVLSASAPDQRSWASEEWQQTIFAHYVLEGLKGAADTDQSGNLSAWELYEYVRDDVKKWARDNRAAVQEPVLLPRAEGRARAEQMYLVNLSGVEPPEPPDRAPGADFTDGLKLLKDGKAWERHDDLQQALPSPAVYAPHLWRLYEATLLRYEQLVRAGDTDGARRLAQKLTDLDTEIGKARHLDSLVCRPWSLALRTLAGDLSEQVLKDAGDTVKDLWASKRDEERRARWEQAQGEARKGRTEEALRLAMAEPLLNAVLRRDRPSADDFEKAYRILRVVYGAGNDRPAELHLLGLLGRDLGERTRYGQQPPPLEDLRLALGTCRLGEETALSAVQERDPSGRPLYAYSELVYPWIRLPVQQADVERHRGENLLFGEGDTSWKAAREALRKAEQDYKEAGRRATAVRQALAVYHEASSWLPWYAQYLARSASAKPDRLDEVEKLTADTERLADLLGNPEGSIPDLQETARRARQRLQEMQEDFEGHCLELARRQPGEAQSLWHELDAVLGVPHIKADTRRVLLREIRRVSQALNLGSSKPPEKEPDARTVQEEARRQARMALAVLGPSAVGESFVKVRQKALEPADPWYATLAGVGDEVRGSWKRLGDELRQLGELPPEEQDARKAEADVLRAERLARKADEATAFQLYGSPRPVDPVGEYRRLFLQDLLRELAERVRADHWWCEEAAVPYYTVSGKAYLKDAQAQAVRHAALQRQRAELLDALDKRLARAGIRVRTAEERLAVTDEPKLPAAFELQVDGLVPAGELAVWAESKDPLEPLAAGRSLKEVKGQSVASAVRRRASVRTAAKAEVTFHARYRGQKEDYSLPVLLAGEPDLTVYQHPPEPSAKIAVQADPDLYKQLQWEQMRIALVFDRSYSMEYPDPSKLDEATDAFQKVLSELPAGPKVSLWTFGHRSARGAPQTWSERLEAPARWVPGPDAANRLIADVKRVKSLRDAASPIVHTMMQACEEDLDLYRRKPDQVGAKLLVVLTDGDDNLFETHDTQYNRAQEKTADFLKKTFDDSDIQILLVTFKVSTDKERASAREQFGVLKTLRRRPGRFFQAESKAELAKHLKEMLEPKDLRCRVERLDSDKPLVVSDDPEGDLRISLEGENLNPTKALVPGAYLARVPVVAPQQVLVNPGDLLLLHVKGEGEEWYLQRSLFKEHREKVRRSSRPLPSAQQEGWLASVQQKEILPNGRSLRMLVSAEKDAKRRGSGILLSQLRPELTWLELEAPGAREKPSGISWRNVGDVLGYPAPTWRLDVRDWPEGALPRLRAWVRDISPRQDRALHARFVHNRGEPLGSLFPKPEAVVGGDPVRDLSVTLETMPFQVRPGEPPLPDQPCLVVRAQYAPNSRVLAELDGLSTGHEHRFYSDLNQYTGIFWPVTEADVLRKDFTLYLISLKAVEAAAPLEINLTPADGKIEEPQAYELTKNP